MTFDFDTVVNRRNSNSMKWDLGAHLFGEQDILPMWVADMDFSTAPCVIEAVQKQAESGIFGYTLRPEAYGGAVIGWLKRRHGWEVNPEWLTYSPGVLTALDLIIQAFSQPGDGVIVQPPVYYPFFSCIENNDRRIVYNPLKFTGNRYSMDL